jgi:hypothetical protein
VWLAAAFCAFSLFALSPLRQLLTIFLTAERRTRRSHRLIFHQIHSSSTLPPHFHSLHRFSAPPSTRPLPFHLSSSSRFASSTKQTLVLASSRMLCSFVPLHRLIPVSPSSSFPLHNPSNLSLTSTHRLSYFPSPFSVARYRPYLISLSVSLSSSFYSFLSFLSLLFSRRMFCPAF